MAHHTAIDTRTNERTHSKHTHTAPPQHLCTPAPQKQKNPTNNKTTNKPKGVLQIEAMAQLAGLVMLDPKDAAAKEQFFFGGIEGCRFRRPVVPGDTLVRLLLMFTGAWLFCVVSPM